jgi:ATP-dependent helicase/nuclease subunit A
VDQPTRQLSLFVDETTPVPPATPISVPDDDAARRFAVDPGNNVVLEASAGTGKTSVLVARYLNLLEAGVEPANILAITFTRKAAAEMRDRIVREGRRREEERGIDPARWNELRDRFGDVAISTIDAFCLSLLREFPLEADLDPGFDLADETEVPRLIEEALDRSLRIFADEARHDPDVALVLAQLGTSRTREGLATLLDRRLVAWDALNRFLAHEPADLTAEAVCRRAIASLAEALGSAPGGLERFLDDGPVGHARYELMVRELRRLSKLQHAPAAAMRAVIDRIASHFLTNEGKARSGGALHPYRAEHYPNAEASKRHRMAVAHLAPGIERIVFTFARDLNVVLARGIRRMFVVALSQYRRALDERSVLDFSDVLQRAIELLRQMGEFAQSRFRLESRYHHVLVDEFQDTSRAQWELASLLIRSWGEGLGLATEPSIFIVGDRKQSIYRFRDAEVAVLQEAGHYIEALRPHVHARRSITRSFRAVPELLEFINELFTEMSQPGTQPDQFTYGEADRFPIHAPSARSRGPVLGIAVAEDPIACASAVAAEIDRILSEETVRDVRTGVFRQAKPGDIAILFRSRASHREFERELEIRGIPAYVYKGLGFFDADEIKDVLALLRYLARPHSDLRAAALLRSRFMRLSDAALAVLAPDLGASLIEPELPGCFRLLEDGDQRVLELARRHVRAWLDRVDREPPAELLERILIETAYAFEIRGPRRQQAWENLKKMRALIRRIQNRGYATLPRIADYLDSLTAGEESNAVIDALDAVNLMTVHASKGLEFPVVFVVNLAKGATGPARPVRVALGGDGEPSISVGPFLSESDETERAREKDETRRLLYVALTRARDRLYLSSTVKNGLLAPGRGSLAEVLPESFKGIFGRAASAFPECPEVAWTGPSDRTFELRLCRPPAAVTATRYLSGPATTIEARPDLVGPVTDAGSARFMSVTEWLRASGCHDLRPAEAPRDPLVGTLVHRLFQHVDLLSDPADRQVALARRLLTAAERAEAPDADAAVNDALRIWRAINKRPDVATLLAAGRRFCEIPFSLADPDLTPLVLRGTIDCLVRKPDGSIAVMEFKTGAPRPVHDRQLDIYVRAARAVFPDSSVEGRLIYLPGAMMMREGAGHE